MRLKDSFYILKELTAGERSWTALVELNPEHPIYEGHFPGQPVVPGVCTLAMIREILSEALGRPISFTYIKECKYISALIPQPGLEVRFTMDMDGDSLKCTAAKDGEPVLKLSATVAEER